MNRLPEKGRIPVVTVMLVLLNLAAFILISGSESPEALMRKYGFGPEDFVKGRNLLTVITSAFVHVDWTHLFGNLVYLIIFGLLLEHRVGYLKFLLIYFTSHFFALMVGVVFSFRSTMVGASAAISGVMGACFAGYPEEKSSLGLLAFATLPLISSFVPIVVTTSLLLFVVAPLFFFASMVLVPIWPFILIFLLYQTKFAVEFANVPVAGEIKYWAHIIGFIAGEFLIIALKGRKKKTEKGENSRTRREIFGL
ncbi:MAG: rhomboid family intramembrane serine protease [Candidatus Hadarchaeales archaeon]